MLSFHKISFASRSVFETVHAIGAATALCVCAALATSTPAQAAANAVAPAPVQQAQPAGQLPEYRIGPNDRLSITVFQVKDLSLDNVKVDANGRILFPLIGLIDAAGKTTTELSNEIAHRLGEKYLQNPQVSVLVTESVSQKVTVEGAVQQAGVFEIQGRTTLLQVIAMARGTSEDANGRRVAVFRQIDGQRHAAVFDLKAIQAGKAEDPPILGSDIVVVDSSTAKTSWHELVKTLPLLTIFTLFR